jgi:hypothetical protein
MKHEYELSVLCEASMGRVLEKVLRYVGLLRRGSEALKKKIIRVVNTVTRGLSALDLPYYYSVFSSKY